MLKKLVKYGNSSAIVLDRAILELLGIKEGCAVKLSTDGKSLIITPVDVQANDVAPSADELVAQMFNFETSLRNNANSAAMMDKFSKQMVEVAQDPEKVKVTESWMPNGEKGKKLQEIFKHLFKKYSADNALLIESNFTEELEAVAEKHGGDRTSPAFVEEMTALRHKIAPNLAHYDKELKDAIDELGGMPSYLK